MNKYIERWSPYQVISPDWLRGEMPRNEHFDATQILPVIALMPNRLSPLPFLMHCSTKSNSPGFPSWFHHGEKTSLLFRIYLAFEALN